MNKYEYFKSNGYKYDSETGLLYNKRGNICCSLHDGYIRIDIRQYDTRYRVLGHRLAWYLFYGEIDDNLVIDHINGVKTDNRIQNLRLVTIQENSFNIKKSKGYSWNKKSNKWTSYIRVNNKYIHLGLYETEEQASEAYKSAKVLYHKI